MDDRNKSGWSVRSKRIFYCTIILCLSLLLFTNCQTISTHSALTRISICDIVRYSSDGTDSYDIANDLDTDNTLVDMDIITTQDSDLSDIHDTIFNQAYLLLNKKPNEVVYINGKKFVLDCIGTVSAIFYSAGIDILKDANEVATHTDNGVAIFYKLLKRDNTLYKTYYPKVGDVIFWDNTWDKNDDGQFGNDPLTHVGIVTKVDNDGTIHYIHENYIYGVVVERMNLYRPTVHKDENGKIINSALYMNSSERKKLSHPWLAGDLFREFGGVISYNK